MYGDMYLITRIISGIVTRMETVSETRVLPSKNDAARVPNHFLGVHKRYAARTEVTEINIFLWKEKHINKISEICIRRG